MTNHFYIYNKRSDFMAAVECADNARKFLLKKKKKTVDNSFNDHYFYFE